MFAKFSPDGTRVAYVRDNNLYVEPLDGGAIRQLTSDGSPTIINGTSDWVNEEELGIRDGFRWSPDGKSHRLLAVRHVRRRAVHADQRHRRALSDDHAAFRIRRPAPRIPPCASASSPPPAARSDWMKTPGRSARTPTCRAWSGPTTRTRC